MNSLAEKMPMRGERLPPLVAACLGLVLVLGLGALDHTAPDRMQFALLHLLAVAFVGWGAGKQPAIALAVIASALLFAGEWHRTSPDARGWVLWWNTATHLIGFATTGWLVGELSRLTCNLGLIVQERTGELRAEADRHRATSERLSEVVQRFEQVTNNIAEAFWLSDTAKTEIIYVSPGYERLWGRSCEELYRNPRSWINAVHPDDRPRVELQSRTQQASGQYDIQFRIIRPDGEVRWVRDRAFPVRDSEGRVFRIAGVAEDVTDRRRLEQELRSGEERLRLAMKAARMVAWDLDIEARTLTYPLLAEDETARRSRQTLDERLQSVHPEDRPRFLEAINQLSGDHPAAEGEYRVRHPDGSFHWIFSKGTAIPDQAGQPKRLLGVSVDITERKNREQSLAEALDLNRKMLASSTTGIAAFSGAGKCLFANEALARITGGTIEALLELDFRKIQAWRACGMLVKAERTLATGEPSAGELYGDSNFGKPLSLDCRLTRFFVAGVPHLLCMADDILERKRAESLLKLQRDLALQLSRTSSLEEGLQRLLDEVVNIEGIDSGGVYLFEPNAGVLALAAHRGLSDRFVRHVARYGPETVEAQLVRKGEPVYGLPDGMPNPAWVIEEGLKCVHVLPLQFEGKVLGSLNVASHTQNIVESRTRFALETVASEVAGAVARIRAEQALHRSEARLRAVIAGAPVILFATDREGVLTLEEGQPLRQLQLEPAKRVGLPARTAYASCPELVRDIERVLQGEEFSSAVQLGELSFDCRYSPTFDAQGQISGCIGVATNTTERQRLEHQLLDISDREQARLGQEIHDGLCQQLVSLAFDANALNDQLARSRRADVAAKARRLADCLDQAITVSRQLARGLFPIRLDADGLPSALEELAATAAERFQVRCRFEHLGSVPHVNKTMATHLFRIAQEAVANSGKHSRAREVRIALSGGAGQVQLVVEDDGCGFSPELALHAGMGLHIMDYRARSMGGVLTCHARPEGGVRVSCCVPVGDQPESRA